MEEREQDQKTPGSAKDKWDKIAALSNFFSATVVALALGIAGHWISLNLGNRDLDIRVMNLAVDILKLEPEESGRDVRGWAISVLEKYSGTSMPTDALVNNRLQTASTVIRDKIYDDETEALSPSELVQMRLCWKEAGVPDDTVTLDFLFQPAFEEARQTVSECMER